LIFDLSITSSKSLVAPAGPGFTSPIAQAAELPASTLTRQESLQPLRARPTQIKLIGNFYRGQREFPLFFDDDSFDAILCIDSMNHFPDRLKVFQEWRRILRPGRRAVFTDPVVITGPVTNDELALRSSIGLFLFVPIGVNEQLIERRAFVW